MGVVKHAQSDLKQFFRYISKMNLYVSMYPYGCGQAHLGMLKLIFNIESAIFQDWIDLGWWFFAFGQACIETANSLGYFKQFNSLVLSFANPKTLSVSQIFSLFYIKYLHDGMIFWLHFLPDSSASRLKPTKQIFDGFLYPLRTSLEVKLVFNN